MGVVKPALPDLDLDDWAARPEGERVRLMCESWATQGFGAPPIAYALLRLQDRRLRRPLGPVRQPLAGGRRPRATSATGGSPPSPSRRRSSGRMLFEVLGLGCGSGPLTGRYVPPIVGLTHFLRPGTIRLPAFPDRVPLTGGHRRTLSSTSLLYAALVGLLPAGAARRPTPCCDGERALADHRRARRARAAGQDGVPGRPRRALLDDADRLRPGRRRRDRPARRGDGRAAGHLVGGGDLEAQPPLPERGHDHGQQLAGAAGAGAEAGHVPPLPRRPAALAPGRRAGPRRHGDRVPVPARPGRVRRRHADDDRRWS